MLTSNERIDWVRKERDILVIFWRNEMADMSQIDMGEITKRYGNEETVRIMKEIMENNEMILKLQKQIGELQIAEEEEKRRQVEYRRKERE